MKQVPMRGRLKGKKIAGFIWAGRGTTWMRKENYFQLEHSRIVTASFSSPSGAFTIRFEGFALTRELQRCAVHHGGESRLYVIVDKVKQIGKKRDRDLEVVNLMPSPLGLIVEFDFSFADLDIVDGKRGRFGCAFLCLRLRL